MNKISIYIIAIACSLAAVLFWPSLIIIIMSASKKKSTLFIVGMSLMSYVILCLVSFFVYLCCTGCKDKKKEDVNVVPQRTPVLETSDNIVIISESTNSYSEEIDEKDFTEENSEEINESDSLSTCILCKKEKPPCIIIPCEHQCVCFECGSELYTQNQKCPQCLEDIETVWPANN